jgi:hypothetical protein
MRTITYVALGVALALSTQQAPAQQQEREWIQLFNGRDISDWIVKIAGHEVGENYASTFRVEDGVLKAAYDQYASFDMRFAHIYYREPFSDYHLVIEYRFTGDWMADVPEWARRNSGVMLHAQDPRTMPKDQDFPISVEMQFLGGFGDGQPRPTGNMCSPGTEVSISGRQVSSHCVNSMSQTYDGDQWVHAEVIVRGDSITHIINGDTVLGYTSPRVGGGVVNGFDPAVKVDGTPLRSGYIALQGEGHPVEFRKVELRRLDHAVDRQSSGRTQMLRKLIGGLGSPCAWSMIGASPCAWYRGCPVYTVKPRSSKSFWTSTPL